MALQLATGIQIAWQCFCKSKSRSCFLLSIQFNSVQAIEASNHYHVNAKGYQFVSMSMMFDSVEIASYYA